MTSVETIVGRTGRSLIPDDLFTRLAVRIANEHPRIDRRMAERIMDQALAFLAVAGAPTSTPLTPGTMVDIGWHTFILHTREYADFCTHIAGGFVHHVPHEDPHPAGVLPAGGVARTRAAVEAAGYLTDPELWTAAARCNQDCSASGANGDENKDSQIPPPIR